MAEVFDGGWLLENPSTLLARDVSTHELVVNGWDVAQEYARSAFADSFALLDDLASASEGLIDIPSVEVSFDVGALPEINQFVKPQPIVKPGIYPDFPYQATAPVLGDVDSLVVPDEPVFTAESPVLAPLTPPDRDVGDVPDDPIFSSHVIPDEPEFTLPEVPELRPIIVDDTPEILDLVFEGVKPGILEDPPILEFQYTENPYSSQLLDDVTGKLIDYVGGFSTGLSPAVEQQIWDRARARTNETTLRLRDVIERRTSSAGWEQPAGSMAENLLRAEEEAVDKDIEESRSIAIAQADLEQKNFQFAFTSAIQLESKLIDHSDAVSNRALEVSKFTIESALQIYNIKVLRYKTEADVYKIDADVLNTLTQAEIAKLERHRLYLDGKRLLGELNEQDIKIYSEQIDAIVAVYQIFSGQLDAVRIRLEQDGRDISLFGEKIKKYESKSRAKAVEIDNFKAESEDQLKYITLHQTESEVFSNETRAFGTLVEALVKKQDADIQLQQTIPVDLFAKKTDAITSQIQGESARVGTLTEIYKTDAAVYDTYSSAEGTRVTSEVDAKRVALEQYTTDANIQVKQAEINIQKMLASIQVLVDSMDSAAKVASQLAASSLSSVNLSGGISEAVSASQSMSQNQSESFSSTNNLSNSTSKSTVDSSSTSQSESDITSTSTSDNTTELHTYDETK